MLYFRLFQLLALCFAFYILPLPVTDIWQGVGLFCFIVMLVFAEKFRNLTYKQWLSYFLIVLVCLFFIRIIPSFSIEMGGNIYVPQRALAKPLNKDAYQSLPKAIHETLYQKFMKAYPVSDWCDQQTPLCWRAEGGVKDTYGFSLAKLWQPNAKFTKQVEQINFHNLATLNAGFINEVTNTLGMLNWSHYISDVKRRQAPFWVVYQFPSTAVGGRLCWQGTVFWPKKNNSWQAISSKEMQCRMLTTHDTGRLIYGISFPKYENLSMHYHPPVSAQLNVYGKKALCLLMLLIILAPVSIPRKKLKKLAYLLGSGLFLLSCAKPYLLSAWYHTIVYSGGNDGLTYAAMGREMVYWFMRGHWHNAFRGGKDVFYFMPGMRYFQGLSYLIFADNALGSLYILLTCYLAHYFLLERCFQDKKVIFFFFLVTVATIMPFYYSNLMGGYAETLAYGLFITALIYANKFMTQHKQATSLIAGLLFALAVCVRPNMAIAAAFCLLYMNWQFLSGYQINKIVKNNFSFSLVFMPLLHNRYYGHQWTLFTTSATTVANLKASPDVYYKAIVAYFSAQYKAPELLSIKHQLIKWLTYPLANTLSMPLYLMLTIQLLGFIILLYYVFSNSSRIKNSLKLIAYGSLGMHIPLLIWSPDRRYAVLAWYLTGLLCFDFFYQILLKSHKRIFKVTTS